MTILTTIIVLSFPWRGGSPSTHSTGGQRVEFTIHKSGTYTYILTDLIPRKRSFPTLFSGPPRACESVLGKSGDEDATNDGHKPRLIKTSPSPRHSVGRTRTPLVVLVEGVRDWILRTSLLFTGTTVSSCLRTVTLRVVRTDS